MVFKRFAQLYQFMRAGRVIARYDGILAKEQIARLPWPLRAGLRAAKLVSGKPPGSDKNPLAGALTELGPSYIKLGQFLATRADIVGPERARELAGLQDRMAPFDEQLARAQVAEGLGAPVASLFASFSAPVAAASIAQVHRARTREADGTGHDVAVKVLRPDIARRFGRELDGFMFAARLLERLHKPSRRLRPVAAVQTLARSVELEMDLRMEAAAMSEMAANTKDDPSFVVPGVDWQRTSKGVLTSQWVDAIALSDMAAVRASGVDLNRLGNTIVQSFLRHAIRDGFFHADMHQGNLFVDASGGLIAIDFGIMGRLTMKDRRFLAEILYGFITRNYQRISDVHFEAGYVPAHQDPAVFAQALRAIGEPVLDKPADEISMGGLLAQLFQVTEQFDMVTQPQLLLLQKTMMVVEGVARTFNPKLNMWDAAEPVVRQWMEQRLGPQGRIEDAASGAAALSRMAGDLPEVLAAAQRTLQQLSGGAGGPGEAGNGAVGGPGDDPAGRSLRGALWVGAGALVVIALALVF